MQISSITIENLSELLPMAMDLWPDYPVEEMEVTLSGVLSSSKFKVFVTRRDGEAIGFIYVSLRTDYVEGSDVSPTGYVEGIYVKPEFRKSGVATQLLGAGEEWLRSKGCRQVGSDIFLDNQSSYAFHRRSGFKEAARLIAFIKDL